MGKVKNPNQKTYDPKWTMGRWWQVSAEVETRSLASYEPFIQPGDLVFDIGSNRGRKVWIFRQLGAKVIAVDPLYAFGPEFVPEFYYKWDEDPMVIAVARAVTAGENGRKVTFQVQKHLPYLSSMDVPWMKTSAHKLYYNPNALIARKVETITLDGLINIYGIPKFLKVDVEGHENAVLQTLSEPVPALNMEYHEDWIPVAAMRHVDGLAQYEWNYTLNNAPQFIAPEWMARDDLLVYMRARLTKEGPKSWGDLYARRADVESV